MNPVVVSISIVSTAQTWWARPRLQRAARGRQAAVGVGERGGQAQRAALRHLPPVRLRLVLARRRRRLRRLPRSQTKGLGIKML